jgi:hypothetical protein
VIIILPCCWSPGKYVISRGYNVKGTGLDPLSPIVPGVVAHAVPEGSAAGINICPL